MHASWCHQSSHVHPTPGCSHAHPTQAMSLAQAPVAKHIWLALLLVSVFTSMQPLAQRNTIRHHFLTPFQTPSQWRLPWHFDERRLLFVLLPKHSAGNNFLGDRYCVKKVPLVVAPLFHSVWARKCLQDGVVTSHAACMTRSIGHPTGIHRLAACHAQRSRSTDAERPHGRRRCR